MSTANFSSARLGEMRTRETWRYFQSLIVEHLLERVYDRWLLVSLRSLQGMPGGVRLAEAMNHAFVPQGFGHIQPREQAQANQINLANRTTTPSHIIREQGLEPQDTFEEYAADMEKLQKLGIAPPSASSGPAGETLPPGEG